MLLFMRISTEYYGIKNKKVKTHEKSQNIIFHCRIAKTINYYKQSYVFLVFIIFFIVIYLFEKTHFII